MKTSLIIVVFNRLNLLEQCLTSVFLQSRLPDEVILTDDGSGEDIEGLYRKWKAHVSIPLKLVRQEHQGFRAGRVRNNGVSISSGDILVFIDQDIIMTTNYLKEVAERSHKGAFLSGYPIRLSETQSANLNIANSMQENYQRVVSKQQITKIRSQYRKDLFYYVLKRYLGLGSHGAKLRSGVCAIRREDYQKVNGFDEKYVGWGNEDDDLGRRLLASGVVGYNFACKEYPLHLYHEPYHEGGKRVNQDYANKRKKEIVRGDYICQKGLTHPREDVQVFE